MHVLPLLLAVTFASPQTLDVHRSKPASIALGDFNGDRRRDVGVAFADGTSSVVVNTTIGSPGATSTSHEVSPLIGQSGSAAVVLADFDGDGVDDWCFTNPALRQVVIFGGASSTLAFVRTLPKTPLSVRAADVDGDGNLDVVVGDATSAVSIIRGLGHGSFASTTDVLLGGGAALAISDINGDGAPDLIAGATGPRVSAANGSGAGTFGVPYTVADLPESASSFVEGLSAGRNGLAIAVRDNAAGKSRLYVFPKGAFGIPATSLQESGGHLHAMFADMDRDGTDDLVVADSATNRVTIYGGIPDGTWPVIGVIQLQVATVAAMVAGDISGDGVADVLVAPDDGKIAVYVNTTPVVPGPRRRTVRH
jgi:hypothetical protein